MSSDFAGLAGTAINVIGTTAIAGEVAKSIRSFSKQERRSYRRSTRRGRR